ncbi:chain length determinant protein EpsF [Roseateles saccharophilus]|uniref:Chain length determinant protein EpsF n=1 Tax=Roseateles saccharophilus TaxID=304 RepID=A0A4R3UR79_ROSSA|nr:chain length determinant protein EpsF [Roseateles saccharophilus]MDG0833438.1 chain length determinant protein EpsF [Roseateles saccharophilus]TCU93093.1 chain length determinant protein EpsF [Roseateles saccharophilus]
MNFVQFLAILRARYKVAVGVFAAIVVLAGLLSLVWPRSYTAAASVVVDSTKPDPLAAVLYSGGINPSLVATQIDVIQSDRVAVKVVRNLKLTENPQIREQWQAATKGEGSIEQWLSGAFQKALDVKPSRESNVITVTYKAADPKFAAALANAFVQAYLETNIEMRVEPARLYSSFFDQRAKEARDGLEKAQSKLSEFQREKGIIATDERLDVESARLTELSTQYVGLQSLASDSGSRQSAARGAGADRMQEVLNNPLIAGLKADQARLEAKLQELTAKLGDRNPQVVETRANLAELKTRIDGETVKVTSSLGIANNINQQRAGEIKAQLEAQRTKVLQMKAVRDDGSVLARDVENAQRTYDQIMQRLNQTTLESMATQSNISVLSQAVAPVEPTSPKLILNMAVAVFAGTLLAVAVVVAMEMLDRRVRGADDVVQAVALPIIGVLPSPNARRLFGRAAKANLMQQRLLGQAPGKSA